MSALSSTVYYHRAQPSEKLFRYYEHGPYCQKRQLEDEFRTMTDTTDIVIDRIMDRAALLGRLVAPKMYGEKVDNRFWFLRDKQQEDVELLRKMIKCVSASTVV